MEDLTLGTQIELTLRLVVALLLLVPALIAHLLASPAEPVDRPRRPWEDR